MNISNSTFTQWLNNLKAIMIDLNQEKDLNYYRQDELRTRFYNKGLSCIQTQQIIHKELN